MPKKDVVLLVFFIGMVIHTAPIYDLDLQYQYEE